MPLLFVKEVGIGLLDLDKGLNPSLDFLFMSLDAFDALNLNIYLCVCEREKEELIEKVSPCYF